MFRHAVGPHAFVAFDKQIIQLRFAPRSTHPAQAIGDYVARFDQLPPKQWNRRQQNAGRITTGAGNEARCPDLFAVNFRQTIDSIDQQLRDAVLVPVKLPVDHGVPDPKIRAQIDHARARA